MNELVTPIVEGTNAQKRAAVRRAQEIYGYTDLPADLRGLAASTAGSGYVELANDSNNEGDPDATQASYRLAVEWYEKAMALRPTTGTRNALQVARSKVTN